MRWYYDQAVYGTNILDYEILDAHSDRLKWYESRADAAKSNKAMYRTYVTIHRKGDFIFPVDVAIRFDDKETIREHWDGRDRWVRYVYDRRSKLVNLSEIDPGPLSGSIGISITTVTTSKSDTRASRKLSHIDFWRVSQLLAWLT